MSKLAFLHSPKTAGTFVRVYMSHLFRINGWEDSLYDGHGAHGPYGQKWRDFSYNEFTEIADREKGKERPAFLHSHSNSYTSGIFFRLKRENWKTFTFIRSLGDTLCSYFFYMQEFEKYPKGPQIMPLRDEWNLVHWGVPRSVIEKLTLDEFITIAVNRKQWRTVPPFWAKVDYVLPYNNENFAMILKETLGHEFEGKIPEIQGQEDSNKEKILTSSNKGYKFHCENGDISPKNQKNIKEDWRQKLFDVLTERCN